MTQNVRLLCKLEAASPRLTTYDHQSPIFVQRPVVEPIPVAGVLEERAGRLEDGIRRNVELRSIALLLAQFLCGIVHVDPGHGYRQALGCGDGQAQRIAFSVVACELVLIRILTLIDPGGFRKEAEDRLEPV